MGALRTDLIKQFLLESLLLNGLAFLMAIISAYLFTPAFNHLIGREQAAALQMLPEYWMLFSSIFISGTLLSGLISCIYFIRVSTGKSIKGAFQKHFWRIGFTQRFDHSSVCHICHPDRGYHHRISTGELHA